MLKDSEVTDWCQELIEKGRFHQEYHQLRQIASDHYVDITRVYDTHVSFSFFTKSSIPRKAVILVDALYPDTPPQLFMQDGENLKQINTRKLKKWRSYYYLSELVQGIITSKRRKILTIAAGLIWAAALALAALIILMSPMLQSPTKLVLDSTTSSVTKTLDNRSQALLDHIVYLETAIKNHPLDLAMSLALISSKLAQAQVEREKMIAQQNLESNNPTITAGVATTTPLLAQVVTTTPVKAPTTVANTLQRG
ncbi:hypothetical protein [Candidatus Chlorohelix sp.]|uniref:hypothetical protein n=1 Tax=Candidatus Chlorohelix sp. TaxID=3139201 RepID=UPI0030416D0B